MTAGEGARRAWAALLEVPSLEGMRVMVDEAPVFGRASWISFLVVDGAVAVAVPRAELVGAVERVVGVVPPAELVDPGVVRGELARVGVGTGAVLGPASLLYPAAAVPTATAEVAERPEVEALAAAVPADDLSETGILELDSPAFCSRTDEGAVAAVCGYRRWPNGVAHLAVLAHPAHRRHGHARRAAVAAVAHADAAGLLPQWRARRAPSIALARSLGFVPVGGQLGLEPEGA